MGPLRCGPMAVASGWLRPLPHQEIAGAEHHAVRLLRLVLHGHKTHARPLRRLADRLGIG